MTTISIHMPENLGLSGFTLYLRKTSDGTLVNTGGDALTESPASSGRFAATVAESWTETLAASVLDSNSLAVRDGWLAVGETVIRDSYPSASGGSGGSSTPPTIVTLQSVALINPGVIQGPSEPLVIGDDYTATTGRQIRMNLLDSNGDPAETTFGSFSLADAGISIQLLLHQAGKKSAVAQLVGTCTFNPAVGDVPPYLMVSFSRTETAKAVPGAYDCQAEAVWAGGEVVTFATYGQIEFVRTISRS